MRVLAGVGTGFLLAVLWFDLMFDVQARGRGSEVGAAALESIAAYYGRVTTSARPMNRLVPLGMLAALVGIAGGWARYELPAWREATSLTLTATAIGLALARTVGNAVRLGERRDPPAAASAIARSVLRDHRICFAAVATSALAQLLPG